MTMLEPTRNFKTSPTEDGRSAEQSNQKHGARDLEIEGISLSIEDIIFIYFYWDILFYMFTFFFLIFIFDF